MMAPIGNQRGERMWPSLPVANQIADVANWFFIGSLVVGVVSTILIVWMAGVKEAYWEKDRTESAERIVALGKEAAEANARAAEAQARIKESEETLARISMPRGVFLNDAPFRKAFEGHPPMKVQISWLRSATDGEWLANRIAHALN